MSAAAAPAMARDSGNPPDPPARPRFGSRPEIRIEPQYVWTTLDEINILRAWHRRGRLDLLRAALSLAPDRIWYGPGMTVDPIRMVGELRAMIEDLEARARKEANARK